MSDIRDCVICSNPGARPNDVIAELSASWVTASVVAPLPGYVCVVSKTHVAEPFELRREEQVAFWDDCMRVAQALVRLLEPRKMNYEIHGNTIPHLHMHLFPRYAGDPYEGSAITLEARFERSRKQLDDIAVAVLATE